jgi:RNA polymerase sigma-70 factor (ECF subfamily)
MQAWRRLMGRMQNEEFYIQQVIRGNASAFEPILRHYKNLVYTVAFRVVKNAEDAEEVAQDSFLKAFRNLAEFKGASKFSTWLFRITYNCALSRMRKKRLDFVPADDRQVLNMADTADWSGLGRLRAEQRSEYLGKAMELLPGEEAALMQLYYYNELSLAEIAEVTGIDSSNAKVKLHRARKRMHGILQAMLKDELEEIL